MSGPCRGGRSSLAALAGMSRSSFCERFTALVGRSPLRYHNEWRLALARDLLTKRWRADRRNRVRIGYELEAAFSRAYKAQFGHSPRVDYRSHKDAGRGGDPDHDMAAGGISGPLMADKGH